MDKSRNLRVSEGYWRHAKQKALDDGVTVREVTERALHVYCAPSQQHQQVMKSVEKDAAVAAVVARRMASEGPKELKTEPEEWVP